MEWRDHQHQWKEGRTQDPDPGDHFKRLNNTSSLSTVDPTCLYRYRTARRPHRRLRLDETNVQSVTKHRFRLNKRATKLGFDEYSTILRYGRYAARHLLVIFLPSSRIATILDDFRIRAFLTLCCVDDDDASHEKATALGYQKHYFSSSTLTQQLYCEGSKGNFFHWRLSRVIIIQ
jgi:hypothetical protein